MSCNGKGHCTHSPCPHEEENPEPEEPEEVVCPTCGSTENTLLGALATNKFVRCRKCGIDFYI